MDGLPIKNYVFPYVWDSFLLISPPGAACDAMPRFSDWAKTRARATEGEAKTMSIAAGRYGSMGKVWRSIVKNMEIPSGKLTFYNGKSPCLMGKLTISMAIFNSYVSLPEDSPIFQCKAWWNLEKCVLLAAQAVVKPGETGIWSMRNGGLSWKSMVQATQSRFKQQKTRVSNGFKMI